MSAGGIRTTLRTWVVGQLRASPTYWKHIRHRLPEDLWWAIRAPEVSRGYKSAFEVERRFYADLFRRFRVGKVFDIGANVGDKTEVFLAAGAQGVVLIEPDPYWRQIHEWRYGGDARVSLRPVAVTDVPGRVALSRFEPGSPLNTLEKKWVDALETGVGRFDPRVIGDVATVEAVTYDQLVSAHGDPDYAKVDVEGHEAAVLAGMTRWPRLLSLEFNLPEFEMELKACVHMATRNNQDCSFNLVVDCREGFASREWMTASGLSGMLAARHLRYLELYVDSGG